MAHQVARFSSTDKDLYRHKLVDFTFGRLDYDLDLTLAEMEYLHFAMGALLDKVAEDRADG